MVKNNAFLKKIFGEYSRFQERRELFAGLMVLAVSERNSSYTAPMGVLTTATGVKLAPDSLLCSFTCDVFEPGFLVLRVVVRGVTIISGRPEPREFFLVGHPILRFGGRALDQDCFGWCLIFRGRFG